jgi:hypothetical protein
VQLDNTQGESKMRKFSNYPIVGQWSVLTGQELETVKRALTEIQKANIENGGWAKVTYRIGSVLWPNQIIKK